MIYTKSKFLKKLVYVKGSTWTESTCVKLFSHCEVITAFGWKLKRRSNKNVNWDRTKTTFYLIVTLPLHGPPYFFETILSWPVIHLVVRWSISHFFMARRNTTEGVREKRTTDKRTIWAWVNSKCKKGNFVTLHSLCICRLTLACICAKLLQATRNAYSSLTVFLTADRCRLRTANSSCLSSSLLLDSISRRLVFSTVRCQLSLCISLRQLLSGFSQTCLSYPTSGFVGDLKFKYFAWFHANTDKGIVVSWRTNYIVSHEYRSVASVCLCRVRLQPCSWCVTVQKLSLASGW